MGKMWHQAASGTDTGSNQPAIGSVRKSKPRPSMRFFVGLTVISLFLAACGGTSTPPGDTSVPATLVEVNLSVVGGPQADDGSVEPSTVTIQASNEAGDVVVFNDENIEDADGAHTALIVPSEQSIVTLYLHEGSTYQFFASAHDADRVFLAYGTAERTVVSGGSNATSMKLITHLGEADLVPRLPTNQLLPGQQLDLLLNVSPPAYPDLRVPLTDFTASFETINGTNIDASSRGLRLRAGDQGQGDLRVTATASGRVVAGNNSVLGSITASLVLPYTSGLVVDAEPPTVETLAFDQVQQIFTGIADDNFGLARMDVFDGPVHLASTDPLAVVEEGLAEIFFPGGGTAFYTVLSLPPGNYELTAVATDTSGLDAELELRVTVE